jgi:L-ascorbate metabolism protein UlaG (beta-lactamase superfamily)
LVADIVSISHTHDDHAYIKGIEGEPVVLDWPGEYEIKGVAVKGVQTFHDDVQGKDRGLNTAFKFTSEQIHILHLGDLGHKLTDSQVQDFGTVDILFVPVGGHYTIDSQTASQVVKQVDPFVVIPMHYGNPRLDAKKFGMLAPVQEFLSLLGATDVVKIPKYSVKKDDFNSIQNTKIILLDESN